MTMKIELYDSYSRRLREFKSIESGKVGLYACGPTVYDYAHIGNLRTYIFEDVLRRVLEMAGYKVKHVVNITDVGHLTSDADTGEDKIEKGSRRTGKTAWQIAELYTEAFKLDIAKLNILEPTIWCRATDHIAEQIQDIKTIERKGYAYLTSDGVYFDTSRLEGYGYLARLDVEGLEAGSRVDLGEKRHPTDFALWKFSTKGENRQMEWPSPWGTGFPGWHIECSAMSVKYLGPLFDIHCGGKDHIPVHHSNEIAQSEVCHNTTLANYWLHGYFLETDQAKMSKSSGEFLRLQTLIDHHYDPLAYRYLCLTAHYRSELKFTWKSLDAAATALGRLRNFVAHLGVASGLSGVPDQEWLDQFQREVFRDLNTSRGLAVLWQLVKQDMNPATLKATVLAMDTVLGLGLKDYRLDTTEAPDEVMALLKARNEERKRRNWVRADALRDQIADLGFEIEDGPDGARIKKR